MAESEAWRVAASIAAGFAIAAVIAVASLSGASQRWGSGVGGFLMGNETAAERLANPHSLQVLEIGDRFAIVAGTGSGAQLIARSNDPQFTGAMAAKARIVAARWGDGLTAVFLSNFTYKEALTLSRDEHIAAEFSSQGPSGAYPLPDEELLGKGWLVLVKDNWAYIIVASAMSYILYVIFYSLFDRQHEA